MAMMASVSIYVLVNVIAHGELDRLVVREVALLAMYWRERESERSLDCYQICPRKVEVSI